MNRVALLPEKESHNLKAQTVEFTTSIKNLTDSKNT